MRLIDADAPISTKKDCPFDFKFCNYGRTNNNCGTCILYNAPTVDAVPVVRCKDCINCVKEPNGELYCDILAVDYEPLGSKKVTDDYYCADGERGEEAQQ